MNTLPNWYRWLLIVIAALILCGCQAPLMQEGMDLSAILPAGPAWSAAEQVGLEAFGRAVVEMEDLREAKGPLLAEPKPAASTSPVVMKAAAVVAQREDAMQDPPLTPLPPVEAPQEGELQAGLGRGTLYPTTDAPEPYAISQAARVVEMPANSSTIQPAVLYPAQLFPHVEPAVLYPAESFPDVEPATWSAPIVETAAGPDTGDAPQQGSLAPCVTPEVVEVTPLVRSLAAHHPDEYLCDGGDGQLTAFVGKQGDLVGLEVEDTVAGFAVPGAGPAVAVSNRVCIYAPRFAAVRKITTLEERLQHQQASLAARRTPAVTGASRVQSSQLNQNLAAQRHLALQPAASFRARTLGVETSQEQALHSLDKDTQAHVGLRVMKFGVHKQSEKARLLEFSARAASWSHDKAVQVIIDEVGARIRVGRRGASEIIAIGAEGRAKLRILKTASVGDAHPGDEVDFALRIDNVGFKPLTDVVVVDNLTTRLEYVAQSQTSSLAADFDTEENEADSLVLRWNIQEPILPGKGGVIRFRCRVR